LSSSSSDFVDPLMPEPLPDTESLSLSLAADPALLRLGIKMTATLLVEKLCNIWVRKVRTQSNFTLEGIPMVLKLTQRIKLLSS